MDFSESEVSARASPAPRLTLSAVLLYERADALSGWLLLSMLVFSPWAFGTTQQWSIQTMNVCGYAAGLLLGIKYWIRFRRGHKPLRWAVSGERVSRSVRVWFTAALALLCGLLLAYCVTAAVNARADFDPVQLTLNYRDYLKGLPHSYDRSATWVAFADYLAWACSFWALRDWLCGMTGEEARIARAEGGGLVRHPGSARLRLLLWVMAVNGALLGLEGIIQRLCNSGKLLFFVQPRIHKDALTQFGPYAYRSNATI